MRKIFRIALMVLLALPIVVTSILSTHGGQIGLLRLMSALASSEESAVQIGALDGSMFGDGAIADVTFSDRDGVWLKAGSISFSWSPRQLLFGRLTVAHLRVGNISLLRKPVTGASTEGEARADRSTFGLPVQLALGEFDVGQIQIAEAVAGEAMTLRVTGSAEVRNIADATAHLTVTRLDGVGASLDARIVAVRETGSLELAVNGSEPEGGFVSSLMGLPSRPAVSLKVDGRGTLDAFNADLALSAAGKPFVAGNVQLSHAGEEMHRLTATAAGYFGPLLPQAAAELFDGKTDLGLAADVTGLAGGAPRTIGNAKLTVNGANLHVDASGGADLAQLYFYGRVEAQAGRADGTPLRFATGAADELAVGGIAFEAVLPDTHGPRRLKAMARIDGFAHPQFGARSTTISLAALQPQPDGPKPSILESIAIEIAIDGIDETLAAGKALGSEGGARLSAAYDGKVLSVSSLDVTTAAAVAHVTGTLQGLGFKGDVRISAEELSRLSALAGHPLKGRATLRIAIDADLQAPTLRATIDGKSTGIGSGNDIVDRLLAPETSYAGHLERTAEGVIVARNVSIANPLLMAAIDGKTDERAPEMTGHVALASLAEIDPTLSGKAQLDVSLTGSADDLRSAFSVTGEAVTLNGRAVESPSMRFAGRGPPTRHSGNVELSARIAGERIEGTADVTVSSGGDFSAANLAFDLAGVKLTGDVAAQGGQLPTGGLKIDARTLARLGHATGMRLQGRVLGDIVLASDRGDGGASVDVTAENVVIGDLHVDGASAKGRIANYLSSPLGPLDVKVGRISKGASTIEGLGIEARFTGDAVQLASKGHFEGGTFNVAGGLHIAHGAQVIDLRSASYTGRRDLPDIRLSAPARLSYGDGQLALGDIRIAVGSGSLRVSGSAGAEAIDARIALQNVPASLAAVAAPRLGVEGTISGSATVTGAPPKPTIDAKIVAKALSTLDTRSRQLPSIDVTTTVLASGNVANVAVRAVGRGGLNLAVDGTVAMNGEGDLDLKSKGEVPLALANVFLAERATRAGGVAEVAARISGTVGAPRVDGSITVKGATVSDRDVGLNLSAIDADIGFTQEAITIRKLSAVSKKGGSVSSAGSVMLRPGSDPSANLSIRLAGLKFGNQDPVAGEIDGEMAISGPLSALVVRGDVKIRRMDITVPNQLPQSVESLDIRHVNAPARFHAKRRRPSTGADAATADPGVTLALDVHASDRIVVRGRGLDAQLGGDVRIRGTSAEPVTDGQFTMSRGRLSIIGRQLDFSRGNIVFTGGLEPMLDMEAKADADGTTVIVTVTGPASKPQFKFASSPELPEDEVVSLLLFNKKLAKLSASQLVQLASEIDKIGGLSSGPSTLDRMKNALGIDVLDVSTDDKGNAQATAGSYINDQTYVGVKQGTSLGAGRVVIDHDLTKNLKARGEVGANGDSKLGVGFEWEY